MKTSDVNYGDLGQEHLEKIDRFRRSRETSVLVVMFTDLKGSTQIAEERGERYTQRMRHVHDEMLLEIIERDGHGLYIKNIGDSIMCIFSEPSMAVKRALEIQQRLHDYNRTNPNEEPMLVRIGMHMGQVAVEDQMQLDIFGRHVNRAARVESLADGGQILLTHGVYDSARGWVEGEHILWVDHGEYLLKGISEPVRIYEVADPEMTLPKPPRGTRHVPAVHRWLVRGGIVAACLILGLSVLLWMTWKGRRVGVLEGRPVIAVMYFTNLTGNETEDILCAGMAETLIT
ncbi:MAG: adenylate/guanylate cyclase domain-containing protein, partial [Deltaproteobacteria bacterium]|nr:adenylate/guanylate cyclase domain-containing protein [Deltaproteobacteria bacterium]